MNKQTQDRVREATNTYFNVLAKSSIVPRPTIAPRVDGFIDGALFGIDLGRAIMKEKFKHSLTALGLLGDGKVAQLAQEMIKDLEEDQIEPTVKTSY